jgi:hypothetical protein
MARQEYQLSVGNPQLTVSLERFTAAWVYVDNPTASWVYLHRGGTSLPTALNADFAIQPGTAKVLTVGGKDFAALLANPTAIPSTQTAGLAGASVVVLFGDNTESPPSIGSLNYNSLGMSELQSTASWTTGASDVLYGPFDLETWGGFVCFVTQSSIAPASIKAQYSDDNVTWYTAQQYALFTGLATTIIFPRSNRYARVALGSPATGVGATGTIQVRAVSEVITQAKYSTTSSGASSGLYTLGNGASQTQVIYTQGIPGIQFLFDGIASAGVINITVSGSQDGSNYHAIERFNLKCSQSAQQLWSIAQPPPYIAVSVQNQTGGTINAPLFFIPCDPEPESGLYLLNQILGTPTDAVGAGTLYGQLQSIALNTTGPLVVANIGATTDTTNASGQGTVIAELHELLNALTQGGSLHGAVDTANATSLLGQLRQIAGVAGVGGATGGALDGPQTVGNTTSSLLGQLKNLVAVAGYGGSVAAAVDTANATSLIGQLRQIAGISGSGANTGGTLDGPQAVSNTTSSLLGQLKNLTAVMGYGGFVAAAVDGAGSTSVIGQLRAIKADDDNISAQSNAIATSTNNIDSKSTSIVTNTTNTATNTLSISNATGLSTDPLGTNTIMGQLKSVANNTNNTAGAAANAAIGIGTTADPPSSHTIIGLLNNIADVLAYGGSANPTLDTSAGASLLASMRQTAALLGQIGNASAPDAAGATSILGQLKSIKSDADLLVTQTGSISQIGTNTTLRGGLATGGAQAVVAATWTSTGINIGTSAYITAVSISHNFMVAGPAATWAQIAIGYGSNAALSSLIATGEIFTGVPLTIHFTGEGVRGFNVGSTDRIWVYCSNAATVGFTVFYTF